MQNKVHLFKFDYDIKFMGNGENKMLRKFLYSKFVIVVNRILLGLFYDKKYLTGKYFYEKRMGWMWAWKGIWNRLFGVNKDIPWPTSSRCIVSNPKNISFHPDSINVFQSPGCYFQNHKGKIIIGKGVYIAPNVGLITTNHDIYNLDKHILGEDIIIGDHSWIGMNSVILPGVTLGPHTIVAAGAVVTKSINNGHCVIGGVPAKPIKFLDKNKFTH